MAEAGIISIAENIVANLAPQALKQVGKFCGLKHELEVLRNSVLTLQAVLDDAEEKYYQNRQIQVWLEKLKDAFCEAQDMLEEFDIEAMRRDIRGRYVMCGEVRTFFSSSNQLAFKLKMIYQIRAVRERIEAIKADRGFHLDERPKREWVKREETHSFIHEEDIIGRDDDKEMVKKFLLDSNVKEDVSILPIVGIGGLGKTALAKYVYGDSKFDLKMWVCVSDDFDVQKIVKKMLACVKKEEPTEVTMELLQSKLRAEIDGKKYLLVLDDVWDVMPETWLSLKTLLVGGARGSKILITTRLPLVAEIIGTARPHFLGGLSDSASLKLLMQMAGRKIELQDSNMLAIGQEIVRKCFGVPLVVRTIGSLLFFKKTKPEWLYFKDYELPEVSQREKHIMSVLRLSYDHLPSHLKQCFALCSLFPKDYKMDKQILVDLWVAEGFIQSNGSGHVEDIAHEYFMDLLWRNFFHDYEKDIWDKYTCKMHDLMHDLACLVAGNGCWAAWDGTKSIHERTRHISYGLTFNLRDVLPISSLKASALRTILSTITYREERDQIEHKESTSEADLCQLIQNFKRLRVLDLRSTKVEKVPRSICELKYLTYLDRSCNRTLKRLPNSITRLQSLQTLNLDDCYALEELPSDIRKLVSLRNLNIDYCSIRYMPHGLGELSSLHRLTRFILPIDKAGAKNYCGLGELNGLNNIRGSLVIENLGFVTDVETESNDANLKGKHFLESLCLPEECFQSLTSLESLYMRGCNRLTSLSRGMRHLTSLVDLSIGQCEELDISKDERGNVLDFHGLHSLRSVEIYNLPKPASLPQWLLRAINLERLYIWQCGNLKDIPEQIEALRSLRWLKIERCRSLTSLPEGMRRLTSLTDLEIMDCPELKERCERDVGEDWDKIKHIPNIRIPW
ncbi:hypothetical protein BT93_F2878 [Corymbia citriodora subsp. variegata]|nr:hypothetical protein BT93_F2878 [Corymbia citriodora subsp. variegata]